MPLRREAGREGRSMSNREATTAGVMRSLVVMGMGVGSECPSLCLSPPFPVALCSLWPKLGRSQPRCSAPFRGLQPLCLFRTRRPLARLPQLDGVRCRTFHSCADLRRASRPARLSLKTSLCFSACADLSALMGPACLLLSLRPKRSQEGL